MQLVEAIPEGLPGPTVVTVGVFDGLHRGHLLLLGRVVERARSLGGKALVLTFSNHPDELMKGSRPPWLQSPGARLAGLEALGVDITVLVPFTKELRDMRAEDFARDLLVRRLGCKALVLGFDSAICRGREGTARRFAELGEELGFEAERIEACEVEGLALSSSLIRRELQAGHLERVAHMLGRPFRLEGKVVPGEGRGRELGFPTANLEIADLCMPPQGVYAVRVELGGALRPAVLNHGLRPTFSREGPPRVEVHLLDFEGDLYGRELALLFVRRIRGEQRFSDPSDLARRIRKDLEEARRILEARP